MSKSEDAAFGQYSRDDLQRNTKTPSILHGYWGSLIYVDLTTQQVCRVPMAPSLARGWLGGRGLGIKLLFDTLPAGMDAFDPNNQVILAGGVFAGTPVPSEPGRIVHMGDGSAAYMFEGVEPGEAGALTDAQALIDAKTETNKTAWDKGITTS